MLVAAASGPMRGTGLARRPTVEREDPVIIETLALSAAIASIDPFVQPGFDRPNSGARQLATPAIQIYSHADSVHRPGFNGRLWVGGMCIGGVDAPVAPDQGQSTNKDSASSSIFCEATV